MTTASYIQDLRLLQGDATAFRYATKHYWTGLLPACYDSVNEPPVILRAEGALATDQSYISRPPCAMQCKTRHCDTVTSSTLPYCAYHLRSRHGLYVAESPGKGLGLFTSIPRTAGDLLCDYTGDYMPYDVSTDIYGLYSTRTYAIVCYPDDVVLDSAFKRSVGAYCNHSDSSTQNAILSEIYVPHLSRYCMFVVACAYIEANTEILVNYGDGYFGDEPPSHSPPLQLAQAPAYFDPHYQVWPSAATVCTSTHPPN